MNDHPGRNTDVISRPSKSMIKDLLSSARQSRVPATVRASKHGWSGGEILPKSPPKIFQKSSKISLKSFQNRGPGVVLGALGASWRVSERLGASCGVLGASSREMTWTKFREGCVESYWEGEE